MDIQAVTEVEKCAALMRTLRVFNDYILAGTMLERIR